MTIVLSNPPPPYEPYPATRALLDLLTEVGAQRNVLNLSQSVQSLYSYLRTPLADQRTTAMIGTLLGVAENAFRDARTERTFGLRDDQTAAFRAFQAEIRAEFPDLYNTTNGSTKPSSGYTTGQKIGAAAAVIGVVAIAPAVTVGALGAIGFSAAGPVAGSLAAAIQSTFYGGAVGAGSLFAMAQSAAMGGIAVSGAATAAGVAAIGGGAALIAKDGCPEDEDEGEASHRGKGKERDDEKRK